MLRLTEHGDSVECKITPFNSMNNSVLGSVYNTEQLKGNNRKGKLLMPKTVSVYIRRYLSWGKSIYECKTSIYETGP